MSGTNLTLAPSVTDIGVHTLSVTADDSELSITETLTVNVVPLVLITEYVEGSSFNKAIELSNLGTSTVDGSKITVTLFKQKLMSQMRVVSR